MCMRLVPFLDWNPAVSAVFVLIVVVAKSGVAKEREETKVDVAMMVVTVVMAMVRIGGRGHANSATHKSRGGNK